MNYTCSSLCDDGFYIPDSKNDVNVTVPEYGDYSCGYMTYLVENSYIPDFLCPVLAEVAQNGCCVPSSTIEPEPETPSPQPDDNDDTDDTDDSAAPNLLTKSVALMVSLATTTVLLINRK